MLQHRDRLAQAPGLVDVFRVHQAGDRGAEHHGRPGQPKFGPRARLDPRDSGKREERKRAGGVDEIAHALARGQHRRGGHKTSADSQSPVVNRKDTGGRLQAGFGKSRDAEVARTQLENAGLEKQRTGGCRRIGKRLHTGGVGEEDLVG